MNVHDVYSNNMVETRVFISNSQPKSFRLFFELRANLNLLCEYCNDLSPSAEVSYGQARLSKLYSAETDWCPDERWSLNSSLYWNKAVLEFHLQNKKSFSLTSFWVFPKQCTRSFRTLTSKPVRVKSQRHKTEEQLLSFVVWKEMSQITLLSGKGTEVVAIPMVPTPPFPTPPTRLHVLSDTAGTIYSR